MKAISLIKVVQAALLCLFVSVNTASAATVNMDGPTTGHVSTLQVKTAVKKKHKGRIIYAKRKATKKYPNCHIIKMITTTGEFRYIRYACGRG